MQNRIDLTGIVLSSMVVGDYDKRLVVLTKERGKITAFARGARKPNSPLLGVSEPFLFGKFTVLEGYDAYRLLNADIKEYFLDVKNDISGICYASYFCDLMEYFCVDGLGDVNMLNLLYVTLKALEKKEIPEPLIRRIFELKALAFDGEAMAAFSCVKCGEETLSAFFDTANGLVCKNCEKHFGNAIALTQSTIYALQYVLATPLTKLYHFRLSDETWKEFDHVVACYTTRHITKTFKSLEILSSLS